MKNIESFEVNHLNLYPGVYISRKDAIDRDFITTFDLRMKRPNKEPVMNTAEIHTIEHIGATFLRNHSKYKDEVIYFGPMGCRTGFYLLVKGDLDSNEILPLVIELFEFISDFSGDIPGATPKECGNYLDMNLPIAKLESKKYLEKTLYDATAENLNYPE